MPQLTPTGWTTLAVGILAVLMGILHTGHSPPFNRGNTYHPPTVFSRIWAIGIGLLVVWLAITGRVS